MPLSLIPAPIRSFGRKLRHRLRPFWFIQERYVFRIVFSFLFFLDLILLSEFIAYAMSPTTLPVLLSVRGGVLLTLLILTLFVVKKAAWAYPGLVGVACYFGLYDLSIAVIALFQGRVILAFFFVLLTLGFVVFGRASWVGYRMCSARKQ